MSDFARMDNSLARSQQDIGESSNLAQVAQTYACNFSDQKYVDYICILSVLAQVAIDNAKRRFDIDLTEEIQRIKNDMDIKTYKYPNFWRLIKHDVKATNINKSLKCPMNCLYDLDITKFRSNTSTLPMSHFYQRFDLEKERKTCKKVEELIAKYSLDVYHYNVQDKTVQARDDEYLLLRSDYDDLIRDIRSVYISKNYIGLMSWLIDRAFTISTDIKRNEYVLKSKINANKSLLVKVLYDINSASLLKIFSKNMHFNKFSYPLNSKKR